MLKGLQKRIDGRGRDTWSYIVPRAKEFMGNTAARIGTRLDPAREHGLGLTLESKAV
jgi:hypothetical protein